MSTKRLDTLRAIEAEIQAAWRDSECFQVEAEPAAGKESYLVTFPYPYMNGRLHLGHAFSLTKSEFAARYQRLAGKHVLWPFAFHGTGMPIAASADKVRRELAESEDGEVDPVVEQSPQAGETVAVDKSRSKRSKAVAKVGNAKTQIEILQSLGVKQEEIPQFANPRFWLHYFVPLGKQDLNLFGIAVDWRRSFITTDINPYYDAFVRWQFRTLYRRNRLKFGLRPSVFSPLDEQPCADHDRASGEGVQPRSRIGYKTVLASLPQCIVDVAGGKPVSVLATCDNPSTYHVNIVVDSETDYGVYYCFPQKLTPKELEDWSAKQAIQGVAIIRMKEDEAKETCPTLLVCSSACARNLVYQGIIPASDTVNDPILLATVKGSDLADRAVEVPFALEKGVVVSTNLSVASQGTGIVVIPPAGKLKEVGEEAVKAASVAGDQLVASGKAVQFDEPEARVVARSGSECVVALCNQWYTDFGDEGWKQLVMKHVSNPEAFRAFGQRASYERTVNWLEGWACSRNYGLGTYLPWEEERGNKVVIESLSDSTIYFAYYTIAHMLQGDIFGTRPGTLGIDAADLNDSAFDYIYCQVDKLPESCKVPAEKLQALRTSFEYWYPMKLRCSGKDLVANHLTMALFHHAAIWPTRPDLWPKAYYTNGHVMVDGEKMSKSQGNFLTLEESCYSFTVDGTRIALAEAGDTTDDANFERSTANAALMKNYVLLQFVEDIMSKKSEGKLRTGEKNVTDLMFDSQVDYLVEHARQGYEAMLMREAVKNGYFEMLAARDMYRNILDPTLEYHQESIMTWITKFCIVVSPIAPHITEHIWKLIGMEGFVSLASYPVASSTSGVHQLQYRTLLKLADDTRVAMDKATRSKKTKEVAKVSGVSIYVAKEYPADKREVLKTIKADVEFDPKTLMPVETKGWTDKVKACPALATADKKSMATLMAFASHKVKRVATDGLLTLEPTPLFDEQELLLESRGYLCRTLGVDNIEIIDVSASPESSPARQQALPLAPFISVVVSV